MGSTMTVRGASRSEDKKRFRICFAALLCFFVFSFLEFLERARLPAFTRPKLWCRVSIHRASVIERGCDDELANGAPGAGERRGEGGEAQTRGEGTSRRFRDGRAFARGVRFPDLGIRPSRDPAPFFRERRRPPPVAPR